MEKKFRLEDGGYEVVLGKFAGQADGSAWVQQGGTIVLSTVVTAPSKEFPGFLPLTVDYRELFSAAGKIPGGYYKREGKFTDKEILTSRLIDRAIRPLFPAHFFNQVQILSTVYSVDKEHMPATLAALGASLALTTSKIPFLGPLGFAEVARIKGKWIINPTYAQILESDVRIIVAGTKEGITMVEGSMQEISENELLDVLFMAHDELKKQIAWQEKIQNDMAVVKEPIVEQFDWAAWTGKAERVLTDDKVSHFFNVDKLERSTVQSELKTEFLTTYAEDIVASGVSDTFLGYIFDDVMRSKITDLSFKLNKRFDLRDFDTVRPISIDVGLLPFNHGSALFTRGRTQALVSATLGGGAEEFKFEGLLDDAPDGMLLLHYNFPPFSVGEVRGMRAPGRREVGHGHLAASAIKQVLPAKEKFPYLIRIVADILESDGSSSMATVCGSTMALLDAGVPIRTMVSGVAMGLLKHSKSEDFRVLTDIAGSEDAFGLMDFKVAGTSEGIVAIQMDIKYKGGLSREVLALALDKARKGRLHILDEMQKVMHVPRAELSALVPRVVTVKVPTDKIGAIIGKGGSVIKDIIEKTATTIDIEDSGLVKVFGQPGPLLDQAVNWVKLLGGQVELGSRYNGAIKRIADFGLLVEIAPGIDGLVHISMIPRRDQQAIMTNSKAGDKIAVEIVDYDETTGRIRLKLI